MIQSVARVALTVALSSIASAQDGAQDGNWPSFRGERASGIAEDAALPTEWSVPDGKGVLWRAPVAGLAHSSPVVWGDKLFVTTAVRVEGAAELASLYGSPNYGAGDSVATEGAHSFRLLCLDKNTGEVLWDKEAYNGVPQVKRHPKSSHANPTPAVDAERVLAFFASEGLYCFDHDGELLWKRDFGLLDSGAPNGVDNTTDYQWGFASSPVLFGERVFVQCDIQDQSFVAALDAKTGADVWRVDREEPPTWGTPTVFEGGATENGQLVVNGFRHAGAYDLATGAEVWKIVGGGDVPVPTPVVAYDLIILTSAHGPLAPIYVILGDAEGLLSMDPAECEYMAWSNRRGIYMQTPIVYGEELYACSDGGILACYDLGLGEQLYRERLGDGTTGFSGSAVAGDGKLYFTSESGLVVVVAAGREFEHVATNDLGETCMSTPAISEGRLYFRTRDHIVAIGE